MSTLHELARLGQSAWLDDLRRQFITSGDLARLRDAGVTGVTSNPTIFEKAISGSTDYQAAVVELVSAGRTPEQMLWDLMIEDIQAAADVFRTVYDATTRSDGFVSIEVSPELAYDTERTIAAAQELRQRCGRPNVMIKVPATREGLPAIRHLIGNGININVTLIFSVDRYVELVEAYLSGLEDLQQKAGDLSRVASVASFFVSRVDSSIDKLLEARIERTHDAVERRHLKNLRGKAAIANSKMAYQRYKRFFSGSRWETLEQAGARPQRCLWASTSTKNPLYRDTLYVEELIGPSTIDTMPDATLAAFEDHGIVRPSLEQGVDRARRQLGALEELGIDLDQVTRNLEVEGVEAFSASYTALLRVISDAERRMKSGSGPRHWRALGTLQPALNQAQRRRQRE